jgi:hypothetical protein
MRHPSNHELALASRGDLPLVAQLRVHAHSLVCTECRQRIEGFRADRARVATAVESFELPRAIQWSELEGEMFGNIRLGLDVSEIYPGQRQKQEESRQIPWRAAAAFAAIAVTVTTGWFLAGPGAVKFAPSAVAQVRSGALVLRGDANGIGVETRGVGMILRNVSSPSARFEVSLEGSVRSSAVDEDSGQVTVSQVYVE